MPRITTRLLPQQTELVESAPEDFWSAWTEVERSQSEDSCPASSMDLNCAVRHGVPARAGEHEPADLALAYASGRGRTGVIRRRGAGRALGGWWWCFTAAVRRRG